jgi:hypothetical protein
MTEGPLSFANQSQKLKVFVKAVTPGNEIGGRTEKYSKFRHEKRWTAENIV